MRAIPTAGAGALVALVLFGILAPAGRHQPRSTPTPFPRAGAIGEAKYQARGFDRCAALSDGSMDRWWADSPYRFAGIFIGGTNLGCRAGLSAAWVSHNHNRGWAFELFWVGKQSSCAPNRYRTYISNNRSTARSQGVSAGKAAARHARDLGFGAGNLIYYDLEPYSGTATCIAAAKAYIGGFDHQLRYHSSYFGGLYGSSCASHLRHFWEMTDMPTNIAPADWNGHPSVYDLACLRNANWNNHRRIHQWLGDVGRSWGGVYAGVDLDCADGSVAANRPLRVGCS